MKIFPRFFIYGGSGGRLISVRWLKTGLDYLSKEGTIFIQYGRKPVKFIYYAPASVKLPLFFVSVGWNTTFRFKGLRLGNTRKPLDLIKAWRIQCKKDLDQSRAGITTTDRIRSGTGSVAPAKGSWDL